MKTTATILLVLAFANSISQGFKEKELKTTITEVTVFLNSAQIFETGSVPVPTGRTMLRVKNLSPYLDEKSIQVKADGDFTILSVNHKLNYLAELKKDSKIDSLKKISEYNLLKIAEDNGKLEVLKEKQSLLDQNKKLGGLSSSLMIADLRQALELYDTELSKIKQEELRLTESQSKKLEVQKKIEQQLKEVNDQKFLPSSEIEIQVSADVPVNGRFQITYLTTNAGWFPKYDVRVKNINSPLELTYKAEVYQNTGVDWKNVKLRFSNGDPRQSGVIPELQTWNLSYARYTSFEKTMYGVSVSSVKNSRGKVVDENGDPLPGVNVIAKGTTIGTVTDAGGNYDITLPNDASQLVFSFIGMQTAEMTAGSEMIVKLKSDVAQLSEVTVAGFGGSDFLSGSAQGVRIRGMSSIKSNYATRPVMTTLIENQTTVEFAVEIPYTLKSNGEKLMVELKKYNIEANYQYYAIPKLDKDAFLVAHMTNWDQYNLLEAEANLYFEDAFIGRTILEARSLKDTLTLSLGRDKNIVIGRTKIEQFSKRKMMAGNGHETRGFKTIVRNKKSQPIKLTVFDQLPVSIMNDINVTPTELSNGTLDDKTGKVVWELHLEPQQQTELLLQYEVKYPKKERVLLE